MLNRVTEEIARTLADRPTATAYAWERVGDGVIDGTLVEIADIPTFETGPRKGRPDYHLARNRQAFYITDSAVAEWHAAHPDVCRRCHNDRQIIVSATRDDAVMAPCPDCEQ